MTKKTKADLALVAVTVGWGASFIFTKEAVNQIEVFNFLAIRFFIGFLLAAIVFYKKMLKINKKGILYGSILGCVLFSAFAVQTIGIQYTSVSNSAFITGLSVVLVPILLALINKKLPSKKIFICSLMAVSGLAMLTLNNGITGINIGDLLTLASTLGFATHIITVAKLANMEEPLSMAIVQIGVVALLSMLASFMFETPTLPTTLPLWLNISALGLVCTAGAFITQNIAQKYTSASHTALIYTLEPVFAAVAGYFILNELLSGIALFGAILIVSGMLLAEVDIKSIFNSKKPKSVLAK
ncbi:MAG: DMT family transporter [Acidaminobacteraceae bacterium]